MLPTELMHEGEHLMTVCNACRYCEGYCAVWQAMERRLVFKESDLNYLANLCHNCSECYYACQYAPPHEFDINPPKTLAKIRCMVDANDTFLKLMGYSRSQVEAGELTWQKLTPPEYMDVSRAEVEKFLATGRVGPYEKEYFRKDGTRQWLLFAGSSLGNNQCVEFCVDISARKKVEEALRASEERWSTTLRSIGDAVICDLCAGQGHIHERGCGEVDRMAALRSPRA